MIVLAAGEGTRMNSDVPKVLHQIGGAPLFAHALNSARDLDGRRILVVGHGGDAVSAEAAKADPEIRIAWQQEQLGTAHAVKTAAPELAGAGGDTVMLFGDTPFIQPETLTAMAEKRAAGSDIIFLAFNADDPARYGRMITDGDDLLKIVEWKDATDEERAITLCNSGVVMASTDNLLRLAEAVGNGNSSGEYYLTDIADIGRSEGLKVSIVTCDETETLGINTRADLAQAEAIFQTRARGQAIADGVTLIAPETVYFSADTHIGRDAVVEPNVVFGPGVTVESGASIRAFSHLEGCHVSSGAVVGPYARLRPGAEISNDAKIGNFVEVKNAQIADGAKVNHLSYVGDATVGADSNIGAGTITCNYDGVFKHRTEIGERVFIGSNTLLVAPVSVGDEAMTASGTVVTKNVPAGDMAVGRAKQENKANFARRFFSKLKAAKAAKQKG
ncbi:MAG: bifunctional UDP-N-acetylglucosamine diphosphorylase/glucosamine-1-phosphate N-acetyltransferase GlmU [Boseongicola sp.]|nr:bifunctional UDP-N-acetylglucosamine diphosphorylase/glucosamine-1-phosphate N-acetyltransferase GlmU [Boseongicola sp.]